MTDLVPVEALPVSNPDADRWTDGLGLVGQWLAETRGNTRITYADAIGFPYHPTTGTYRDTSVLRNGVTWLAWCARNGVHLLDADRQHVVTWANALRSTPHPKTGELLSHMTSAHTFTAASAFYVWAMKAGHATRNPMSLIDRKKLGVDIPKEPSPTRSLSRREVALLQQAADNDPVESVRLRSSALVATLFRLGMRVSELCNLRTSDIERTGGVRVAWVTLKGERRHPYKLPREVNERLDRYLSSRGVSATVAVRGQLGGTSYPVFATGNGAAMGRKEVDALLKRLAKRAGLDDPASVTPHVGRHSLITALREAKVADDKIQRFVGHKHAETTDRYGHHVLDLVNSPADVADELFEEEMRKLNEERS